MIGVDYQKICKMIFGTDEVEKLYEIAEKMLHTSYEDKSEILNRKGDVKMSKWVWAVKWVTSNP